LVAGAWYTGFETAHASGTNGIGTFTLNETNSTIKVMVYKDVISKVGIKFARPDGGSTGEISVTNTKINEWEELTFNFAGKIGEGVSTGIDQIIVFPDFIPEGTTRSANHVCYVIISLFCKNSGSSCCHCLLLPHQHLQLELQQM
jgi:hypothetical protein